jgi:hypothetical protein
VGEVIEVVEVEEPGAVAADTASGAAAKGRKR